MKILGSMTNEKSVKIIILILAIVLIGAIVFDVTLVNNAKTGNEKTASTAQTAARVQQKRKKHILTLSRRRRGK